MALRRWQNCLSRAALLALLFGALGCLVAVMLGVPQSFLGQWWMKPPRYPNATLARYAEGEVCLMPAPAVYCYEWFYRTPDSEGRVLEYYSKVNWPLHAAIAFEWRKGRRFDQAWVAERCLHVISTVSCYQIIVHPSGEGDTEIYILERGAMGDIPQGER